MMQIYDLEMRLQNYVYDEFDQMMDEDFIEFGTIGTQYTKQNQLSAIGKESPPTERFLRVEDYEERFVDESVILVTYKTTNILTKQQALRSSIWRKKEKGWKLFFHQGTLIK